LSGYAAFRTRVAFAAISALALFAAPAPAPAADPENCLLCHQFRGLARYEPESDRVRAFFVDPDYHAALLGAHARLACTDCHARSEVSVVPHEPVRKVDCTQTCHLGDDRGGERRFSHANIADVLASSAHSLDVLAGLNFQGGPLLEPDQSTCLYCHDEPLFRNPAGLMPPLNGLGARGLSRCDSCHKTQVPVDVDYYLRHIASRLQPARTNLEGAQVCAVCHSDPVVRKDHDLPDSVASYVRSFHGKAALLGDEATAGCVSCHAAGDSDVHFMLGRTDVRSPVHPTKVGDSCSTIECHPGASPGLSDASMHLNLPTAQGTLEFAVAAFFIVLTVLTFGPSALFALLGMTQIVLARREHEDARLHALAEKLMKDERGRKRLTRFTPIQRVQHWGLAILFTILAITGFPLKFSETDWARWVVGLCGGLGNARQLHHWSGIILVIGLIGHLVYVGMIVWRKAVASGYGVGPAALLRSLFNQPMWITFADLRQMWHAVQYYFYLRKDRPAYGRFNLKEKFEYIGVFWGTVLLGVTGILLWGETIATNLISGRFLNVFAIAHTYEAFLAIIHVGILHIYNVMLSPHVFPMSMATLTGTTPMHELVEEHGQFVRDAAADVGIDMPSEGGH
jgi:cytochrome b subunit of formate dehydrogenase